MNKVIYCLQDVLYCFTMIMSKTIDDDFNIDNIANIGI